MRYLSTGGTAPIASFRQAVLDGLAPDGGLYLPVELPRLDAGSLDPALSYPDRACRLARPFVEGELDEATLHGICADAFSFKVPLHRVTDRIHVLELFWGPTFAFKDFGARFLARVMNHFATQESRKLTILVATSGDTGSAVAHGFAGMEAIDVVLLYPSGRVSRLQEQQLTTLGGNVVALEVEGSFDDCQAMVKAAFADQTIQDRRPLSSANSINFGRLLPQLFYYVHACAELAVDDRRPAVVCVPSGNFGNVTGALMAWRMGLPLERLVVGTNANDVVPRYLAGSPFEPRPAVQTPASAMDVGNPSNFARIQALLEGQHDQIRELFRGYAVATTQILATIRKVKSDDGYLVDPHSAVGFAALSRYLDETGLDKDAPALFVATAHPGKFGEAIREATGTEVEIPPRLAEALTREKRAIRIAAGAEALRTYLLDTA